MHGIGGASENWSAQLAGLSDQFRVIAWDMPGYGGSDDLPDPAPDTGAYAAAALALLDFLEIERCHLVGQSVAALIAGHIAARHPGRLLSLTLSHPLTGLGGLPDEEREQLRAARLGLFEALGPMRFAYEKGPAILAPGVADAVRDKAVETMARVRPDGFRQAVEMMSQSDLFADLPQIGPPVLVIGGEFDPVAPKKTCRAVAQSLKNSRLEIVSGVGHYSAMERADAVNGILAEFFRRSPALKWS